MAKVVIVGSLNMDFVIRVSRMPSPGETVLGNDFQIIPGGKGANQAVAAARLGAVTAMIGKVGADEFGSQLVENLREEGVGVLNVLRDPDAPSGIAMITLDENGQNSIVVASGANMSLTLSEVEAAWSALTDIDVVVMPLEVPLESVEQAAELAREGGARVVLNPAPPRPLSDELLRLVDVLVPNESEAEMLSGKSLGTAKHAEQAARALQDRGVGAVVLTLGDRGAMVLDSDGQATSLQAHNVEVTDTTAAGDAFVAALAVAIAEGNSILDAARFANAAGALAVMRMGAQPAMPARPEVDALLDHSRVEP